MQSKPMRTIVEERYYVMLLRKLRRHVVRHRLGEKVRVLQGV